MIWESSYWKRDLLRRAAGLRRRVDQRRWSEASFARLEQTLMVGFYSIRKLHEARKLSDDTVTQHLGLLQYPVRLGFRVTRLNWHNIDKSYDLSAQKSVRRDLFFLCNQFIHSYIFMPEFDNGERLSGVLFASDLARRDGLFRVGVRQLIDLFERVGSDYPGVVQFSWDEAHSDYQVSSRSDVARRQAVGIDGLRP